MEPVVILYRFQNYVEFLPALLVSIFVSMVSFVCLLRHFAKNHNIFLVDSPMDLAFASRFLSPRIFSWQNETLIRSGAGMTLASGKNFVVISHRWDTPEHPDPSGAKYARWKALYADRSDGFWIDFCSIDQEDVLENNTWKQQIDDIFFSAPTVHFDWGYSSAFRSWCLYEFKIKIMQSLMKTLSCVFSVIALFIANDIGAFVGVALRDSLPFHLDVGVLQCISLSLTGLAILISMFITMLGTSNNLLTKLPLAVVPFHCSTSAKGEDKPFLSKRLTRWMFRFVPNLVLMAICMFVYVFVLYFTSLLDFTVIVWKLCCHRTVNLDEEDTFVFRGYCFGTIVRFSQTCSLLRSGATQ